jgi:hypothetical protein
MPSSKNKKKPKKRAEIEYLDYIEPVGRKNLALIRKQCRLPGNGRTKATASNVEGVTKTTRPSTFDPAP